MGFLAPAFLLGALAAALPILLHLRRRRVTAEVSFSAVQLLHRARSAQSERRRPRDLLLLALRVGALCLLAAAFARPWIDRVRAAPGPLRIVAVDVSSSMAAPGLFAQAVAAARGAVEAAGAHERIAVIAFGDGAEVVAEAGTREAAGAALERLVPSSGGTQYGPALARAAELAGGAPARLVMVSDLVRTRPGERLRLPAGMSLDVRAVGPPPANLAVTDVRVAPRAVMAAILNTAGQPRTGAVAVLRDGAVVGQAPFSVPPGGVTPVMVAAGTPEGAGVSVSIVDAEGLPADNVRHAVAAYGGGAPVLVVTGSQRRGRHLTAAVEAMAAEGDGLAVAVRRADALAPGDLADRAAVVVLATRGLDLGAREGIGRFLTAGGGLVVAASEEVEPAVLASWFDPGPIDAGRTDRRPSVSLGAADLRHPVVRTFAGNAASLAAARFDRAWRLGTAEGVVARFTDGTPALVERAAGSGRVLLFASDVDRGWNDLPVHPAFVPFAAEAVRHVSRPPASAAAAPSRGVPGIHRTADGRLVAVNVDPRESAGTRLDPAAFAAEVTREPAPAAADRGTAARAAEAGQGLWRYGLVMMLAVLLAEGFIGRR